MIEKFKQSVRRLFINAALVPEELPIDHEKIETTRNATNPTQQMNMELYG